MPAGKGAQPAKDLRAGQRSVGFWTTADARRELHRLALDQDRTAESLLNEALNLLFRAYDRPTIAPPWNG